SAISAAFGGRKIGLTPPGIFLTRFLNHGAQRPINFFDSSERTISLSGNSRLSARRRDITNFWPTMALTLCRLPPADGWYVATSRAPVRRDRAWPQNSIDKAWMCITVMFCALTNLARLMISVIRGIKRNLGYIRNPTALVWMASRRTLVFSLKLTAPEAMKTRSLRLDSPSSKDSQ